MKGMLAFETFRKRGRNWEYLGERSATEMRAAALQTSYAHHIKVVGCRPAHTNLTLHVYRFKQVATLHHK